MKVHALSFRNINIDGQDYVEDIVINGGKIEKRKKKKSKKFRSQFGHTPVYFRLICRLFRNIHPFF